MGSAPVDSLRRIWYESAERFWWDGLWWAQVDFYGGGRMGSWCSLVLELFEGVSCLAMPCVLMLLLSSWFHKAGSDFGVAAVF